MLMIHRADVRRSDRAVVRHVSLRAESPGLLFLVGPGGAGKSSLLSALAGDRSESGPRLSGMAELDGCRIDALLDRRAWIPQHAQLVGDLPAGSQIQRLGDTSPARAAALLAKVGVEAPRQALDQPAAQLDAGQRRVLAVLAGLQREASLYLVDEPTANMEPAHVELVRQRLAELATRASLVVATHNRQDCLTLGGRTALIAGGTVQECADTARFFSAPSCAAARTYVMTGNCGVRGAVEQSREHDGIWWLVPGLLAGLSRPGLVGGATVQFRHLAEQGVGLLVNLEEQVAYAAEAARSEGLQLHHMPVPDMAPPSFAQAVDLCRLAEPAIRNNQGVALHCRGGLGRTGTGLAAILAWFGDSAEEAIAKVRAAQPRAIQSMAQLRFIHDFADRIRGWH